MPPESPGAMLLESLLIEFDEGNLRTEARRVFRQASDAFPPNEVNGWWRQMVEAFTSLGKKARVLQGPVSEVLELVTEGAAILARSETDPGRWIAVVGPEGKRFRVIDTKRGLKPRNVRERRLTADFRDLADANDELRFVIIERTFGSHPGRDSVDGELTPLARLRALLAPESSDIITVVIYALIVGLLTLATPIAVEALVNTVAFGRFLQPVVVLALLLFTFLAFSAALRGVETYVVEIIQRRLFGRIAGDLAFRLPRVRIDHLDDRYAPELVNRFFDVVTVQKVSAQLLLEGIGLVLSATVGMAVLAFYHPWLAGFDLALIAMIAIVVFVLGRGAFDSSINESKKKYAMAAWLEDVARCPITFRTDGGSEFALERADRMIHDYLTARRRHFRILMRQILFALGLQALASTVLLGIGGWLVVIGELTLGQLVAAELIVAVIVGSVAKLGKHMESFYDLIAAVDKLGQLFDLPIERLGGELNTAPEGPATLELMRVSWKRPSGRQSDTLSLSLGGGDRIAVLGRAGTGKSRLFEVIYGLRTPVSGHLTIDGMDPRDLRPDILRRRIALVREPEIFEGTVAENIHLERPWVTSQDVNDVLDRLGVLDELLVLPNGLSTRLPSGGGTLSSSLLRRLMLARALVGRPGLLLIDGLLDGLPDDELEEIQSALVALRTQCTIVVATGRGNVAELCSQVIQLEGNPPHAIGLTDSNDSILE